MKNERIRQLYQRYLGAMQEWQIRLAIARIQRINLPPEAWDETMQELALAIHRFKFDPNKAHAASQETIFCRLIDNRLRMLARKNGRHAALMERMKVMRIEQEDADRHDSALNDADVQRVLRRLTPRQREISVAMMNGETVEQIATRTDRHPETVWGHVRSIRRILTKRGLNE